MFTFICCSLLIDFISFHVYFPVLQELEMKQDKKFITKKVLHLVKDVVFNCFVETQFIQHRQQDNGIMTFIPILEVGRTFQ